MNWFGATDLVTVAKSTLKGAQKAIDKALDIKDDNDSAVKIPPSGKDDSESFFSAWGVKSDGSPEKSSDIAASNSSVSSSLWGSFTGSFFENLPPSGFSGDEKNSNPISEQPKRTDISGLLPPHGDADIHSDLSLGDDQKVWEGFSKTQLVVESLLPSRDEKSVSPSLIDEVTQRHREKPQIGNSHGNDRLSAMSAEGDRKSSESVEVLGSASCTASPDSDLPVSLSAYSLASSAGVIPFSASSPESVEVIPESSVSHSTSIEILGSNSSCASLCSPSPSAPTVKRFVDMPFQDLASPESVEVLPEDEEDASQADDSYASASESTMTQATVLEPQSHIGATIEGSFHYSEVTDSLGPKDIVGSCISGHTDSSVSSLLLDSSTDTIQSDHSSFGRPGMQLTLTSEYPQLLKSSWTDSSQHSTDTISPTLKSHHGSLESIPLKPNAGTKTSSPPQEIKNKSVDAEDSKSSDSKQNSFELGFEVCAEDLSAGLTSTDSSGEGTLIESSSDDTIPGRDRHSQPAPVVCVRNLLADAMVDDLPQMTLNSPISVESRSECVRLGSEQTSGHTSGDELETTTSSDIEIISSPNGDGSSTASRQSPAKHLQRVAQGPVDLLKFSGKIKGHQREPSEASSGGSDDSHGSEMDRLLKRLSEMTELLEARENKLLVLSRSHAELEEYYQDMKSQLENVQQSRLVESKSLNEEFTRRLSALERKFQQAIRDKDSLQKQLEQSKSQMVHELSEHVGERDETIKELREEGEKLSRQQLQQSNLIKKLRAKEKESESIIKSLRDQVDNMSGEIDRLKRSLAAKEDVERSQIEAVHQLTAQVKKQSADILTLKEQRDHFQLMAENIQVALDKTEKELNEARTREEGADQRVKEATQNVEESARVELEAALFTAQQHKHQIMAQMDTLREQLAQAEAEHCRRESDLQKRLESAERRSEELSQQLSEASRPLLRQLQTLQASSKAQQDAWERQEKNLVDALAEAQTQVGVLSEAERTAREELLTLRSKVSTLESKLAASSTATQSLQNRNSELQSELDRLMKCSEEDRNNLKSQKDEFQRQVASLEHQLSVERAAVEAEKRRTVQLQEQLRDRAVERDKDKDVDPGKRDSPLVVPSGHSSPTISFGRESVSESVSSVVWPLFSDDAFESTSVSGRNIYESVRLNHTTSVLEGLQSQLKLREGEVQQLQWELSRREAQRCALTAELSALSVRAEEQETRLNTSIQLQEDLAAQLSSLRTEYDALLQLYGEKLEETQELRLDLQDVKDMYKAQIDQLLKREEGAQLSPKPESSSEEEKHT